MTSFAQGLAQGAPQPGFGDAVFDSQASFRALLDALARPGEIRAITLPLTAPAPLSPAATALALTLFDHDTPVWLDAGAGAGEVPGFLAFHCGCPLVDETERAAFAMISSPATMPPLHGFAIGEDRYPETSTTLVIDVQALAGGDPVRLSGPGIADVAVVAPVGLPVGFWEQMRANRGLFPLGVDVVLAAGGQVLGLPRTVRAEV